MKKVSSNKKTGDENTSIYAEYFSAVDKFCQEYGSETIVLMQVGSFFEVYGLQGYNGPKGKQGFYSNIDDFCRICDTKLAEKKNTHQGFPVLLAGTPEYTLENTIQRLVNEQKTVAVFVQEDDMTKTKSKKRVFHSVYSPGTFLPLEEFQQDNLDNVGSNHVMAIWIRSFKSLKDGLKYLCSFSCVNILSGQSYLYEYSCLKLLSPTTFDDLERAVSSFEPNEILFIKENPEDEEANRILQYIGINIYGRVVVHRIDPLNNEKIQRLNKPVYVRETLTFFFKPLKKSFNGNPCIEKDLYVQSISEFQLYEFATQNLCFLLDWVQGHNPNLIKYISVPIFSNNSFRMILANHTLKQLNIISQGSGINRCGRLSSVAQHLNKTGSSLGSRLFQYQIQNPTFDEVWLNQEYRMTDWFINVVENTVLQSIRRNMGSIRDIERIGRQLVLGKVWPSAIYWLYHGIQKYTESVELLEPSKTGRTPQNNLLDKIMDLTHRDENRLFLNFIEKRIQLDICQDIKSLNTNTMFFQKGVCKEMDKLQNQIEQARRLLQGICVSLNAICSGNRLGTEEVDHVKIHETQKSGCYLHITQTRGAILKDLLKKGAQQNAYLEFEGGVKVFYKDIRVASGRGEKENIEFPLLVQTCNNLLNWEEQMSKHVENVYRDFLRELQGSWMSFLNERFRLIALLDVATTKAFLATEYNYCSPVLVPFTEDDEASFFEAQDLRHVLIEHLQKNEMYVANDLSLGHDGQRGILLYGTNAVGKTSLIKSAGIAIIMAQAGLYVPCSYFRYRPYRSIYSRILGNDDLFRGLSTFVVEMSELRVILRMADDKSLVLGDEICSGTETESALSIFTAGLQHLYNKRVCFLFATHFHEIVNYSEIEEMSDQLSLKHLGVFYDRERGELIYNRKLQEGAGNGTYGLEVAKSLSMPSEFLEQAYKIRQKYFSGSCEEAGATPLSFKTSRYNADKIRGFCEICRKKMGDEVHHIKPQQEADDMGMIGYHHKNHPANLLNVCFECHDNIHGQTPVVKK